jgi:hypothetical protein
VRERKGWRHIHFAADDFNIGPGFAGPRRLHRFIEFAERLNGAANQSARTFHRSATDNARITLIATIFEK